MVDTFTRKKRSEIMAQIKGSGNLTTELRLIKIFRAYKIIGWRRNKPLFGRPDFIFPKAHVAIFVDGCFWHGCRTHKNIPKTNHEFWVKKIEGNILRDQIVSRTLRNSGWQVLRIWEHEVKTDADACATKVIKLLKHASC